jgi:hypothetical protein
MPLNVLRIVATEAGEWRAFGFSVLLGCHVSVKSVSKAGAVSAARFFFSFSTHLFGITAMSYLISF